MDNTRVKCASLTPAVSSHPSQTATAPLESQHDLHCFSLFFLHVTQISTQDHQGTLGACLLIKTFFSPPHTCIFPVLFSSRQSPGNIPPGYEKRKNLDTRKNSVRVLVLIQPSDFMHRHATLSAKMGAHLPPPGRPHPLRWRLAKHNFRANLQEPSVAAWSPQPTLTELLPLNWESVDKNTSQNKSTEKKKMFSLIFQFNSKFLMAP